MIVLDANYILRYLLDDNEEMSIVARETIQRENCLVFNEVIAEVIYVLSGVYKVPKTIIAKTLSDFILLRNLGMHEDKSFLVDALRLYQSKSLDFIDCYLCALNEKYTIKTFDKNLMKCLHRSEP